MNANLLNFELELLSVILLFILFRHNSRMKHQKGYGFLVSIYILTFVAAFDNMIRLMAEQVGGQNIIVHITTIVYMVSFGVISLLWLFYCGEQFDIEPLQKKSVRWLVSLPLLVVSLLVIASSVTGWVYIVDALGQYHRGNGYCILLLYYSYLVATILLALVGRTELSNRSREERAKTLWTVAPAVLLGILPQMVIPNGLSSLTMAVAISLLSLLANSQYKRIIIDNLTELPNRYGLDEEFEEQLRQYRKDKSDSFYIIACDLDNFKTINDRWGHAEGDRALQLVADVLTRVADKNDAMAFRNGGDEFVIITDQAIKGQAEEICRQANEAFNALHFRNDFKIEMSMGFALFDGKSSVGELMKQADRSLYQVKRERKSEQPVEK